MLLKMTGNIAILCVHEATVGTSGGHHAGCPASMAKEPWNQVHR